MNVFHKVTLAALKKNKTRTAATIIGIILSAALICAVTTSFASLHNFLIEYTVYKDGDWHGSALSADKETLDKLGASNKLEGLTYAKQLGYATAEGCTNPDKPYLYVLGTSEGFDEMMPVHLTDGRYPTSSREILLPEHLSSNGGVNYKLGDTLTLGLGDRLLDGVPLGQTNPYINDAETGEVESLEVRETVTYTVVGFYERPSFEEYSAPGYTALTVSDSAGDGIYDIYFKMKSPSAFHSFVSDMGISGTTNVDLLMYSGVIQYPDFLAMFYGLAALVIALILFGSVALIYNAFSISVSERTKQFGLLSSVGATKKQIRKTVFFEALVVSAIGIPIGILVGIGGIGITFQLLSGLFLDMGIPKEVPLRLCVTWVSVVSACAIALITVFLSALIPAIRATRVTAMDAIRQSKDVRIRARGSKTSKLTYRLFGLPAVIATKHFKRNRRKYRTTVISLFMSIVLFVSASSFVQYMKAVIEVGYSTSGYDLIYYADALKNGDDKAALLAKLNAADGITAGTYIISDSARVFVKRSDITGEYLEDYVDNYPDPELEAEGKVSFVSTIVFVHDDEYRRLLSEHGLDEAEYFNADKPLAVAFNRYNLHSEEKKKYVSGDILASEGAILSYQCENLPDGCYVDEVYTDENGKQMCKIERYDSIDEGFTLPYDQIYSEKQLTVGAVVDKAPYYLEDSNGLQLIYPASMAPTVMGEAQDMLHTKFLFKSDDHARSYDELSKILKDNGIATSQLYDYADSVEDTRNMMTVVNVFAYGFIILISLIAATNVFNTISTSITLRRREFAMLRSVGMTERDLNKMMNYECILYGSKALLLGLPTSCIISFIIYMIISEAMVTGFTLPWLAIGIAIFSVFLVVFSTMLYSMRKIKKENPIDALKNENF